MGEKETAATAQAGSRLADAPGEGIAIDEEGLQKKAEPPEKDAEARKTGHDTVKNTIQNIR